MHFAVGMGCAAAITTAACAITRRGWRSTPLAMTAGGFWAMAPDMPRLFREDFPSLPFASTLGSKQLEHSLHDWGDLFFFHHRLDAQPHEFALHGLLFIILFYNLAIGQLLWLQHRERRRSRTPKNPTPSTSEPDPHLKPPTDTAP
jgi:hypothetical protein